MRKIFLCAVAVLWSGLTNQAMTETALRKDVAPKLCVAAGEVLEIEVRFRAAYQNVLELHVGDRVLRRFDNWFDRGTDADQGAGVWSLPVFSVPTCIVVTSHHRSGSHKAWAANRHQQRTNGIGFEDAVDNDFNDAEILFRSQVPMS